MKKKKVFFLLFIKANLGLLVYINLKKKYKNAKCARSKRNWNFFYVFPFHLNGQAVFLKCGEFLLFDCWTIFLWRQLLLLNWNHKLSLVVEFCEFILVYTEKIHVEKVYISVNNQYGDGRQVNEIDYMNMISLQCRFMV